jgi:hypothetical protein
MIPTTPLMLTEDPESTTVITLVKASACNPWQDVRVNSVVHAW